MHFLSFTGTSIEIGMGIETMARAMKHAAKGNPKATLDDLPGVICLDWKKSAGKGVVEIEVDGRVERMDMPSKQPVFLPANSITRLRPEGCDGVVMSVSPNGTYDFTTGADSTLDLPLQASPGDDDTRVAALKWLREGRVGSSSYTLCAYLTGVEDPKRENADDNPWDASDFNRCAMFFEAVPLARSKIGQMTDVSPEWAALVPVWDELESLLERERAGGPSKLTDRMREILDRPKRRLSHP